MNLPGSGQRTLSPPNGALGSHSTVLVVGAVRNCARHIESDVSRMASALSGFARVQWLLVESDSDDGTPDSLAKLALAHEDFRYLRLGDLRERLPLRTARLAFCRNAYLEELRASRRYADVDFVIVADFDAVNSLLTESAIASCWQRDDWAVCTSNQARRYYDVWALRHPDWSPNDCWMQYRFLTRNGVSHARAWSACVRARMVRIPPEADWIEVDSAFGGLAIYRRAALDCGQYVGVNAVGQEVCEHVALHAELRARGLRIFINPGLINGDSADHTDHRLNHQRVARAIGKMVGWARGHD